MLYRIIQTTDYKNVGMELGLPELGDTVYLDQGFEFVPDNRVVNGDKYILSNSNYIIILEKI